MRPRVFRWFSPLTSPTSARSNRFRRASTDRAGGPMPSPAPALVPTSPQSSPPKANGRADREILTVLGCRPSSGLMASPHFGDEPIPAPGALLTQRLREWSRRSSLQAREDFVSIPVAKYYGPRVRSPVRRIRRQTGLRSPSLVKIAGGGDKGLDGGLVAVVEFDQGPDCLCLVRREVIVAADDCVPDVIAQVADAKLSARTVI